MKLHCAWRPSLAFYLALSFCFTFPLFSQDPQPVTVTIQNFFAPVERSPYPIEEAWLREIRATQSGSVIRVTLYNLTLSSIKDALIDAFTNRSVDVRVIADKSATCTRDREVNPLMTALYEARIPVKQYRNLRFTGDIMHNKFLIIDDKILANGSCNFTIQGTRYNHENMMLIKVVDGEAPFIQDFVRQFDRMWANDFSFSEHEFIDWMPLPNGC